MVESVLFKQLLHERMQQSPNEVERELYETALDGFEDWADEYGLPTTPQVLAAYLVELHSDGVEIGDLKFISEAYLHQHDRDVHVPIRAALQILFAVATRDHQTAQLGKRPHRGVPLRSKISR